MENIKVVQYGCGNIGKQALKYMIEDGLNVVGAIDVNPDVIGKDIAEIAGLSELTGVIVSDDADKILESTKPDVAVLTLFSDINKIYPFVEKCVKLGINVITSAEDFVAPWEANSELADKLDTIAKEHNVTVIGCGSQDGVGYPMLNAVKKSTHTIDKLVAEYFFNTEVFGKEAGEPFGVGLDIDAYNKQFNAGVENLNPQPSVLLNNLKGAVINLGWHFKSAKEIIYAATEDKDLYSPAFDKVIKAGDAVGTRTVLSIETEEGIIVELNSIVRSFGEEQVNDKQVWTFVGNPTIKVALDDFQSMSITVCGIVNRVKDVYEAKAGLYHTCEI